MEIVTREFHIYGLVQGVGFRPFVCDWANAHGLAGYVKNDGGIVTVSLTGPDSTIREFTDLMLSLDGSSELLPGAVVSRISSTCSQSKNALTGGRQTSAYVSGISSPSCPDEFGSEKNCPDVDGPLVGRRSGQFSNDRADDSFRIVESTGGEDKLRMLPPDIATCPECVAELFDPKNRRYRHPFISCTACGPRYTIMSDVPYDRVRTTMDEHPMCSSCSYEYYGSQSKNVQTADRKNGLLRQDVTSPSCPGEGGSASSRPNANRRHYAQTICCNDCGPRLMAYDGKEECVGEEAFDRAIGVLRDGGIVAVKDVGGYHLCFDAKNAAAEERLREWKHRERKPFAVMFCDMDEIRRYACVSPTEEDLLTSPAAPIVLLRPLGSQSKNASSDRYSGRIGAFLPSNPLQHMILKEMSPLVMTSGNRGGEPIITDDDEMIELMATGVPDLVLYHDRRILYGLDDSIYQVTNISSVGSQSKNASTGGRQTSAYVSGISSPSCPGKLGSEKNCPDVDGPLVGRRSGQFSSDRPDVTAEIIQVLRRARGLVPSPVWIGRELENDTFAAGGDLKSVFALGRKDAVYMSGHFGDLDDVRCTEARGESIAHMENLLGISPEMYICDKHPLYNSVADTIARVDIIGGSMSHGENGAGTDSFQGGNMAGGSLSHEEKREAGGYELCQVQHHFAHILSVAAEHDLHGSVLGVAFDGTGYGDDSTIWGGEFLLCDTDAMTYKRVGHLKSIPVIGGDESARDAKRTAFCFIKDAKTLGIPDAEAAMLGQAIDKNINTVKNSSMGRLFDAAAAILDISYENSYEGECPVKLQYAAEDFLENMMEQAPEEGIANNTESKKVMWEAPTLSFPIYEENDIFIADSVALLSELNEKKQAGMPADALAYAFHEAVADMTVQMCSSILSKYRSKNECATDGSGVSSNCSGTYTAGSGTSTVALSGGTMQNSLLLKLLIPKLRSHGVEVYLNHQVPAGDGGLALGQIFSICQSR